MVNKTTACAAQFAKCIFLHVYSHTTASSQLHKRNKTFITYLITWHKTIFGDKL